MTEHFADYVLVERLGPGINAQRHLAVPPRRLGLDDELVILVVTAVDATSDQFARAANELRLLHSLRSPHLVELLDAGGEGGRLFFATRRPSHGSLESASHLSVADRIRATADAALGADALHDVGVAHRNIHPATIVVDRGRGCLDGLGLAEMSEGVTATRGTGPMGALQHTDPAMLRGEPASRATDIWSLGTTLHAVLSDRPLFGDVPTTHLLAAARHLVATPPHIDERLDPSVGRVIARCLAAPGERFDRARDVASALSAAVS